MGALIHLLVLGLLLALQGRPALVEAFVSYLCQGLEQFSQLLASLQPWQPAHDGLVPSEEHNSPCWVRIEQLAMAPADRPPMASQPPGCRLPTCMCNGSRSKPFNAHGQALGSARRLGYNRQALVSGQRASFIPAPRGTCRCTHVSASTRRSAPFLALVDQVQVSLIEPSSSLQAEQRSDLGNLAIAVLLVASALLGTAYLPACCASSSLVVRPPALGVQAR